MNIKKDNKRFLTLYLRRLHGRVGLTEEQLNEIVEKNPNFLPALARAEEIINAIKNKKSEKASKKK